MQRTIIYADTCKNCGRNIIWRSEAQGWLHTTDDRRCAPFYAEPTRTVVPNG